MAITVSNVQHKNAGSEMRVDCVLGFGTYSNTGNDNTTGELLLPATLSMTGFTRVVVNQESGYQIEVLYSQDGPTVTFPTPVRFKVLGASGGGGQTGDTSGGTPEGNIEVGIFTGDELEGHDHTFTGDALAGHNHTFTGSALAGHGHTFTGSAMSNHNHAQIQQAETTVAVVSDTCTILIKSPNIQAVYATAGGITGPLVHIPTSVTLATGQFHYDYTSQTFTFFAGDTISSIDVTYLGIVALDTAGTPAGTIDSVSAGTPAGTLDSVSGGTPEGTLDSVSGGTPSGEIAEQAFTGVGLAAHSHTGAGGATTEVPNGTDLSSELGSVQIICYGV